MQDEKPKCPECQTELVLIEGKVPEECQKCGFLLKGYEPFKRWLTAALKENKPKTPEKKQSKNPFSILSEL